MPAPKQLGEVLMETGLITVDKLNQALEVQKETEKPLGTILVEMGFLKEEELLACLKEKFGISSEDLDSVSSIEPAILELIPRNMAEKYLAIPLELKNRRLIVAMADPFDMADIDDIKFRAGYSIVSVFAFEPAIRRAIDRFYSQREKPSGQGTRGTEQGTRSVEQEAPGSRLQAPGSTEEPSILDEGTEVVPPMELDSPLNRFLHGLFNTAVQNYADEIHIESHLDGVRIRYRVDNSLYEVLRLPGSIKSALLTRLKRLMGLETTLKSGSQKKYVGFKLGDRYPMMDLSVFSCPLSGGEKLLLKLKDKFSSLTLDQLGLETDAVKGLWKILRRPTGCILVTGPVRSGKITTLYTLLGQAASPELNVMTLEDSTAYPLKGVNQIRVAPEEGFTYLAGLQSIHEHRPDLIMVDKLVDPEVADKAFDLAARVRLISSLGALDTIQAVMKLLIYLPATKLANNLNCVITQRLVRKICENCKEPIILSESHRQRLGLTFEDPCYTGKGCISCGYTGYQGLTGIFEILDCSDAVRRLLVKGYRAEELKTAAIQEGMTTLRKSGLEKVKQGITTVSEVIRSTLRSTAW